MILIYFIFTTQQLAAERKARLEAMRKERAQKEIAAMQVGAKSQTDKANLAAKTRLEGMRMGVDIAKTKEQMMHQSKQTKQEPKKKGE